jgi:hypothetical protein
MDRTHGPLDLQSLPDLTIGSEGLVISLSGTLQAQRGPGRRATLSVRSPNSKLQTRCSDADQEGILSERLKGEEPFSYFLRLVVSHALLSTDARVFLFPAILVAQVLVGAMGNTPPMWVHGVGDISAGILSCWFLYICVWGPGF